MPTLEEKIKTYPKTYPRYSYKGENAMNPAYEAVDEFSTIKPNEKKIWALRGDLVLAVGVKNVDMNLHKGAPALMATVTDQAQQFLNFRDRFGHPSLAVKDENFDGSVYMAGWVCQRNDGAIEIALQSGRFQNKALTNDQRDDIELYIARRFMSAYGDTNVIFYDHTDKMVSRYFNDLKQSASSEKRVYTPTMVKELNQKDLLEREKENKMHVSDNKESPQNIPEQLKSVISTLQAELNYYKQRQGFLASGDKKTYAKEAYKILESLKKDLDAPNVNSSTLLTTYHNCKTLLKNLEEINLKIDSTGGRFGKIIEGAITTVNSLENTMEELKRSQEVKHKLG